MEELLCKQGVSEISDAMDIRFGPIYSSKSIESLGISWLLEISVNCYSSVFACRYEKWRPIRDFFDTVSVF